MASGPKKKIGSGLGFASKVGVELVASIVIAAYGGYILDGYIETHPWFMLLGLILGSIAGFCNLYRSFQELENNEAGNGQDRF